MYRVRFHLAKGPHFQMWQIKSDNLTTYINPEECGLLLWRCKLVNHQSTAQKIFDGDDKTVCAWILCEDVHACNTMSMPNTWIQARFNPRKCVHWYMDEEPSINLDGVECDLMYTYERKVYGKGLGLLLP